MIACASNNLTAFADPLSTTPLAHALLFQLAMLLKSLTQTLVNADVQPLKHVDVDSSSPLKPVHVLPIQLLDVCPTCTSSTLNHVIVNACNKHNACVVQLLSTPLVDALPTRHALKDKDSMLPLADVFALLSPTVVVVSSSTPTLANVLPTQLPDVCPTYTDSTTTDVTVSASTKQHANATLKLSMPLADALPSHLAQLHKPSTLQPALADVQVLQSLADVVRSSALPLAHVSMTQPPPVQLANSSTETPVNASASTSSHAHVEPTS